MPWPESLRVSGTTWFLSAILFGCSPIVFAPLTAAAQQEPDQQTVETLAAVLRAEDSRSYDGAFFRGLIHHPDPGVRRQAALAMGRIGSEAAVPLLIEMTFDQDTVVQQDAVFALGLIQSEAANDRLRQLVLNTPPDSQTGTQAEAVTAIAWIGGPVAVEFFNELLERWFGSAVSASLPLSVRRAVGDAWLLGEEAPVKLMEEFLDSPIREVRWRTVFALSRLGDPRSAAVLLRSTSDREAIVRSFAVKALTADYARASGLDERGIAARVNRLIGDSDPHVRVNALRALGTYGLEDFVPAVVERLKDNDPNVQAQALQTLGLLGGTKAIESLRDGLRDRTFSNRRAAILGLSRAAGPDAMEDILEWYSSSAWRDRSTAAQALANVGGDSAGTLLEKMLTDPDGRVVAAAYTALAGEWPERALQLAPGLLSNPDPVVRARAAQQLVDQPSADNLDALIECYRISLRDPISDARIAAVEAIGAIADLGTDKEALVSSRFVSRFPTADDYLVRRAALDALPVAAARWGSDFPIQTGRQMGDYRQIARELLLPADRAQIFPRVIIETNQGDLELELFAGDAPIAVHTFLQLVDRRYFDGGTWHRVVPNFVVQDGDPRGDGWGGPGYALRDEPNRKRYLRGTVGVALSGPDTGGSQFFITLSPQPHLDGIYTVIGRVDFGDATRQVTSPLDRITLGDRIRRIRRP